MATYVWYCPICADSFEVFKPMVQSAVLELCPKCGGQTERRYAGSRILLSGIFKWYDKGDKDVIVSYPGGKTVRTKHNKLYSTGGI